MIELIERMRQNPQSDWRMADIEAVCRLDGVRCTPPRSGGSHYKISHSLISEILTVPFKRPIKPVYIRKVVQFIDAVRSVS